MTRTFRLAKMDRLMAMLTLFVLGLPGLFLSQSMHDSALATLMSAVAASLLALYAWVWTRWRPPRFEVTPDGLAVVFPLGRKHVPADSILSVEEVDREELKRRYGHLLRVGVGGLWGGFGWLKASRGGWVEFYVSRLDDYVLMERQGAPPLLISPERPAELVDAVRLL